MHIATVIHIFIVWPRFVTRTTYDNIDGPGGTIYVVILGPAGPLMYPDQISCFRPISHKLVAQDLITHINN